MDFLKGYIGLSAESGIEAESGLYVDSLPDITTGTIEKLISNEGTADAAWEKIEHRTLLKFRTLFIAEVNKVHKVHDIAKCECLIADNKSVLATALWYLLGAEVMLTRVTSSRTNVATIDRSKPREIREYFEAQFKEELQTAVASIDIHASACFQEEDQLPVVDTIVTRIPII